MKSCRLLAVSTLLLITLGCNGDVGPTGVRSTNLKPVDVISDGAHGGNHDFFFLPPLVPLPVNNPDFELGKFDNSLVPVLTIEICELVVTGTGLPAADSPCRTVDATHPLTKKFNAGTVQLVNLPLQQNGWWTLLGLPSDGFYYVLWDTRQSNLVLSKYYRIKVFVNGSTDPIGYADVDPMGSLREWKYSRTGQVIQMVDDVLLPIPFRIEKGAFCATGAILCKSVVVPNDNPNGTSTIVQLQGTTGSIAGAEFPDGWLPPGVDNVVVTVSRIAGGPPSVKGSRSVPCHDGLPLLQFDGCFKFTTNPELQIVDGKAFAKDVRIAVCYVLHDTNNELRDWAEIWSSGPRELTHALRGAPDATILTNHDCVNSDPPIVTMGEPNVVTRLAAAGWRRLKDVFTVPTAHAVDLGLGGLTSAFSNEGPAITAQLRAATSTQILARPGDQVFVQARTVGAKVHDATPLGDITLTGNTRGLPGLPVTFSLVPPSDGGSPGTITSGLVTGSPITVESNGYLEGSLSGGFASVVWQMPPKPGTYSLTVTAPALGGPLTFTATVVGAGVVDQSNIATPANLSALINECCRYAAQTFVAGVTGSLVGVNVDVSSNSPYPLNVAIRTTQSGAPTSTILGQTTLAGSSASLSDLITFPQPIPLVAGTQYAIVVSYPTAPPPGAGQVQGDWMGTTGDQYGGGALYHTFDGVSWFASGTGYDVHFRTYMAAAIP